VWTPAEIELADSLEAVLLRVICSQTESDLNSMVHTDLSLSQLRCLVALAWAGRAMPITGLADRLGLTLATAGRAVDRLVAHHLVIRREDPDDRRIRRVSLSAKGRQVVSGIDDDRRKSLLTFVHSLTPSDATRLLAALRPIVDSTPNTNPTPRLEEQPA
jgi:DNA-binding MarR family transcriptional regulator